MVQHVFVPSVSGSDRYHVEPLTSQHLAGAGRVLCQSFKGNVLADLGHEFARELLSSYVVVEGGCGYVCTDGDEVVGFVVGTENSQRHRRTLLRTKWHVYLQCILARLILSPQLVWRLARYFAAYFKASPSRRSTPKEGSRDESVPPASLVLLAVHPEHRRCGLADRLMHAFLTEMGQRGVDRIKLVVSTDNSVATNFYLSRDWRIAGQYAAPEGGSAYRLIYHLNPGT